MRNHSYVVKCVNVAGLNLREVVPVAAFLVAEGFAADASVGEPSPLLLLLLLLAPPPLLLLPPLPLSLRGLRSSRSSSPPPCSGDEAMAPLFAKFYLSCSLSILFSLSFPVDLT